MTNEKRIQAFEYALELAGTGGLADALYLFISQTEHGATNMVAIEDAFDVLLEARAKGEGGVNA